LGEAPESGAWRIDEQSGGGEDGEDSDVVLWAGADAMEAESAIEIADFSGEKEVSGATRLGGVAAETIVRFARGAGGGLADFDFERRKERGEEIKLADRADEFTESGPFEKGIEKESAEEISDDEEGGGGGAIPPGEGFGGEEEKSEESEGEPFGAEKARPRAWGKPEFSGEGAREGEGAGVAKEVACDEQSDDREASPVNPRENAREVIRAVSGTEEAVENDRDGEEEGESLEESTGGERAEDGAEDRKGEEIER
jgi:hypothetical protein